MSNVNDLEPEIQKRLSEFAAVACILELARRRPHKPFWLRKRDNFQLHITLQEE